MSWINLWLVTLALQVLIFIVNAIGNNWPGAAGGAFGAWMCFLYWDEIRKNKNTGINANSRK